MPPRKRKFGSADELRERADEFKPIWVRVDEKARSIYAGYLVSCGMSGKKARETAQLPWHYLGMDVRKTFLRRAILSLRGKQ